MTRLTAEERVQRKGLISKGKTAARKLAQYASDLLVTIPNECRGASDTEVANSCT